MFTESLSESLSSPPAIGRIAGIAVKTARRGPMRPIDEAEAVVGGGITEDLRPSPKRGITLLSREQWDEATAELGVELSWLTRRANVLVEGLRMGGLIGRRVRLGTVELLIRGETTPCKMMDGQHSGLREALAPDCRAGVYGQVLRAGRFRVGDPVELLPADETEAP